jgi:hypothetical protein
MTMWRLVGDSVTQRPYASKKMSGDGSITARLIFPTTGAVSGLMFRDDLTPTGKYAAMVLAPNTTTTVGKFLWRTVAGSGSGNISTANLKSTYWLRLTRVGTQFTGYVSSDGITWSQTGSATIAMNNTIYIGLADSGYAGRWFMQTATFDNVTTPQDICTQTNPSVVLTPMTQTGSAGGTVSYSVDVTNLNSAVCIPATFKLTTVIPAKLTGTISPSAMTLGSKATASAIVKLTSLSTEPAANYNFGVLATNTADTSFNTSVTGQYVTTSNCIYMPPTLTITPSSQNTSGTTPVNYNFTITNNHSNACGWGLFRFSRGTDDYNIVLTMNTNGELIPAGKSFSGIITATPNTNAKPGIHNFTLTTDVQDGSKVVNKFTVDYTPSSSCVRANPTVTLTPSTQTGPAGGSVNYSVSVTNQDSTNCTAATFNITSLIPPSLTGTMTPVTLTIPPKGNATASLKLTSVSTVPSATYSVTTKVSNAEDVSFNASVIAKYTTVGGCVYAPPTITITPTSQSTTGTQPVVYSFTITNNHSNDCSWGLFRFSRGTDDYNIALTMKTNGELILPGKSFSSIITATPNANTNIGSHSLSLTTDVQGGSKVITQFNLNYSKVN